MDTKIQAFEKSLDMDTLERFDKLKKAGWQLISHGKRFEWQNEDITIADEILLDESEVVAHAERIWKGMHPEAPEEEAAEELPSEPKVELDEQPDDSERVKMVASTFLASEEAKHLLDRISKADLLGSSLVKLNQLWRAACDREAKRTSIDAFDFQAVIEEAQEAAAIQEEASGADAPEAATDDQSEAEEAETDEAALERIKQEAGGHEWRKSCLVTQRGGFDTYRCENCGADAKRYGVSWPPRPDKKKFATCPKAQGATIDDEIRAEADEPPEPTAPSVEHVDPETLNTSGGTQPRAELSETTIEEYAEAMKRGDKFPPAVVFCDGEDYWLAAGFHRHAAAIKAEQELLVEIRQGTRRDAILFSVGENATHGLRRTNADKRRAVETLLRDEEWSKWSDRKIATQCGVSHVFAGTVRGELSGNGFQMDTKRKVERGDKTYEVETEKIGSNQKVSAESADLEESVEVDESDPPHSIKDLYDLLRGTPDGIATEQLLKDGFTLGQIDQAKLQNRIDRDGGGTCIYVWRTADIVAALEERGTLSRLQFGELGCQAAAIYIAVSQGAIKQPETGMFALPGPDDEEKTASTEPDRSTDPIARKPAAFEDAKPATPRPTIEDLLKGQLMTLSFVFGIPGLPGKANVTINVGNKPEKAVRACLDTSKLRPFPEPVMEMIVEQIKASAPKKAAKKKPAKKVATKATKKAAPKKAAAKKTKRRAAATR